MADDSTRDRSGGDASKPGGKKVKFVPSVPGRRRKAEDDVASPSGAGGAASAGTEASHETFKELLKAAHSEAQWEKGGSRGGAGGRGSRGGAAPKQEPQAHVMFGAQAAASAATASAAGKRSAASKGAGGTTSAAAKSMVEAAAAEILGSVAGIAPPAGAASTSAAPAGTAVAKGGRPSSGGKGDGRPSSGKGGRGKAKAEPADERGRTGVEYMEIDDDESTQPDHPAGSHAPLDHKQYYPTILPMRPPPDLQHRHAPLPPPVFAAARPAAARQPPSSSGAPPTDSLLSIPRGPPDTTARDLGLLDGRGTDRLLLVQMPSVLPISATRVKLDPSLDELNGNGGGGGGGGGMLTANGGASTSAAAAADPPRPLTGASLGDLPSGSIGKLLVFQSGKLKLQMGGVLMDVCGGLPTMQRQDVAVIDTQEGSCALLGDIAHRVVVSPDIWQLMDDRPVPKWRHAQYVPPAEEDGEDGAGPSGAATDGPQSSDVDMDGLAAAAVAAAHSEGGDDVVMAATTAAGAPSASGKGAAASGSGAAAEVKVEPPTSPGKSRSKASRGA